MFRGKILLAPLRVGLRLGYQSKTIDISIESIVFRVVEINSDKPDACSESDTEEEKNPGNAGYFDK